MWKKNINKNSMLNEKGTEWLYHTNIEYMYIYNY